MEDRLHRDQSRTSCIRDKKLHKLATSGPANYKMLKDKLFISGWLHETGPVQTTQMTAVCIKTKSYAFNTNPPKQLLQTIWKHSICCR